MEKGLEKGKQIGIEEGEQIGLEKGEQIGLEKGLEKGEFLKSCKMAIKCFSKKMDIKDISELTELPVEILSKISVLYNKYGDGAEKNLDEL